MAPSVSTPSTSRSTSRMRRARSVSVTGAQPQNIFRSPQVVQVQDAGGRGRRWPHERGDLAVLHDLQGLDGQHRRCDGPRACGSSRRRPCARAHRASCAMCRRDSLVVMMPSTRALDIDHARHAEALARDLVDHLAHRRVDPHARHAVAAVHQRVGAHEALAQLATGCSWRTAPPGTPSARAGFMARASPRASEAVVLAVGTRFIGQASSLTWQSSATSAFQSEARAGIPGHGDELRPDAANELEHAQHFLGLAAVGERQHDVRRPG